MSNRQLINAEPSMRVLNSVQAEEFRLYIKNAKDDDPAELLIYEQIGKDPFFGDGVGAKDVAWFLATNRGKAVTVRINSPGGLAFDGVTIFNSLMQHDGPVTTIIEGIAASAASVIALAGQPAKMFANASMKVHRAWGLAIGNTKEMADVAEWLAKLDGQIAATMAAKSGRKKDTMLKLMDGNVDGTWFTAEEALREGLIDEIVPLKSNRNRDGKNEIELPETSETSVNTISYVDSTGNSQALTPDARAVAEARAKLVKNAAGRRVRLMEIGAE